MPRGTQHDETGWLDELNGERVLRRDDGGSWRLEMPFWLHWRSRRLLGKHVRVKGVRVDYNVLELLDIWPL